MWCYVLQLLICAYCGTTTVFTDYTKKLSWHLWPHNMQETPFPESYCLFVTGEQLSLLTFAMPCYSAISRTWTFRRPETKFLRASSPNIDAWYPHQILTKKKNEVTFFSLNVFMLKRIFSWKLAISCKVSYKAPLRASGKHRVTEFCVRMCSNKYERWSSRQGLENIVEIFDCGSIKRIHMFFAFLWAEKVCGGMWNVILHARGSYVSFCAWAGDMVELPNSAAGAGWAVWILTKIVWNVCSVNTEPQTKRLKYLASRI